MAKYKVTYETNVRPTGLPDGAEVEEIPTLPLTVETPVWRKITVEKGYLVGESFLTIEDTAPGGRDMAALLARHEARQIAHALLEAIGEPVEAKTVYTEHDPEPPANVTELVDRGGDTWHRIANDRWAMRKSVDPRDGNSWETVRVYAPLTVKAG